MKPRKSNHELIWGLNWIVIEELYLWAIKFIILEFKLLREETKKHLSNVNAIRECVWLA